MKRPPFTRALVRSWTSMRRRVICDLVDVAYNEFVSAVSTGVPDHYAKGLGALEKVRPQIVEIIRKELQWIITDDQPEAPAADPKWRSSGGLGNRVAPAR